ncbi:hypothetical protein EVAR_46946_1 [Eumeta japonica]|uniref:Uncharacterized protein n=1 Tax=Eumeta variegata TaxID=151549 RepID=A0A4C1YIY0_EUMVA|nr:hypothetical protein EVAR_46946_1 [Eumeta japonica]
MKLPITTYDVRERDKFIALQIRAGNPVRRASHAHVSLHNGHYLPTVNSDITHLIIIEKMSRVGRGISVKARSRTRISNSPSSGNGRVWQQVCYFQSKIDLAVRRPELRAPFTWKWEYYNFRFYVSSEDRDKPLA